ncbi:MAG: DUF3276 family protein [Treponema sp.]|jgi:hypothetical protein|nr:DUF3276 family protein [Treponema sp.]
MGVRGELYSNRIILPNRTYFFNVKENRMGDLYLNIVESKNRDEGGFDRQSVILFADDLQEFLKGFDESLKVLEKAAREKRHKGDGAERGVGRGAERGGERGRESVREKGYESRREKGREGGRDFSRGAERGSPRKEKTQGFGEKRRYSPGGGKNSAVSRGRERGVERGGGRGGKYGGARGEKRGAEGGAEGGVKRREHGGNRGFDRVSRGNKRVIVKKHKNDNEE